MKTLLSILIILTTIVYSQEDRVFQNSEKELSERLKTFTQKAIKSFPSVKKRFTNEFKEGDSLYITVRLFEENTFEQFYLLATKIEKGVIHGTVVSDIRSLKKVKKGDSLSIKVKDMIDWCIILKGGQEEGNYSGRYIELFNDRFVPLIFSVERTKERKLTKPKFKGAYNRQGQSANFILDQAIIDKAAKLVLEKQSNLKETEDLGIIAVIHYDLHLYKLGTFKELNKSKQ